MLWADDAVDKEEFKEKNEASVGNSVGAPKMPLEMLMLIADTVILNKKK